MPNKPLPRQKPTAETFSDTPLPGVDIQYLLDIQGVSTYTVFA